MHTVSPASMLGISPLTTARYRSGEMQPSENSQRKDVDRSSREVVVRYTPRGHNNRSGGKRLVENARRSDANRCGGELLIEMVWRKDSDRKFEEILTGLCIYMFLRATYMPLRTKSFLSQTD